MTAPFTPILAIAEQTGVHSYLFNGSGPLGNLYSELHYHLYDMSRYHQAVIRELNSNYEKVGEWSDTLKGKVEEIEKNVFDEEELELWKFRVSEERVAINNADMEIARAQAFADEFTIIGLWATAEKYLGLVYRHIESNQTNTAFDNTSAPYRWDQIKNAFLGKAITLESLDGYLDANECRLLNNAIKHGGKVGSNLTSFSCFSGCLGQELHKIDFEMQRYYNGVYSFLGDLIRQANKIIDPSFQY